MDNFRPLLAAMIRQLFEAEPLDDVRAATAHGARLISPYDALTLRERGTSGQPTVTMRKGNELDANAKALERHLCQKADESGWAVSTLDRLENDQAQALADAYARRSALCLTRPLRVFGENFGMLTLHYDGRPALVDAEFDALRTFADYAAIALYNARARQDLRDFEYTDPLTGLASRRQLDVELARLRDRELSLLLIDFDGLKEAVGAALAANVNEGELAARLGGDEFVVVLPGADGPRARLRAEELTEVLDRVAVPDDLESLFYGASVGAATAVPGEDSRAVLRRASNEMRSRKRRRKTDRDVLAREGDGRLELPRDPDLG